MRGAMPLLPLYIFVTWAETTSRYHSTPFTAKAKNAWSYASTPALYLRDVGRDNFTLPLNSIYC